MKNLKKLTRKQLELISGGDTAYAICDADGYCPPTIGSYYCSGGMCYRSSEGGGNPGGSCTEPKRLCQPWETGCGCVYF
ncbi:hypothetical protein EG346_12450 [Chryseobacterium carnipullorum]|uniref:Bacteriocin-type signal sequence-containing protein n=1 Tax=Chryseobacterium carnipullorum TaxID=1124835 RepID=A0A376DPT6_CHRCU|nr:hypothetical protein [Chryseobacterium carnipullorum]MDN5479092.1 hypothetical protein [Chryseobacterium sp.]AZA51346.1 hypothetical protein EG346_12450 [Chryseobacterium carnipullorum]AZA67663.1 hypothetical protein EG345_03360 [Chryseobacterium carnipullorum]STC93576.1 Uncharacterised protein [Chryseobacterium carnipullorum]HBV17681.1 hypothetical protein [Chryseobacterium carnipullorum]